MPTSILQRPTPAPATLPDTRALIYRASTETWLRTQRRHAIATGDTRNAARLTTRLQTLEAGQ